MKWLDLGIYGVTERAIQRLLFAGHRDSLIALTDTLTWKLLTKVWQGHNPPAPSLRNVGPGEEEARRLVDSLLTQRGGP